MSSDAPPRAPSAILDCTTFNNVDFGEFAFETDHDALRSNEDYLRLLKTLSILHAQKAQVAKDVELLLEARSEALNDPIGLVQRLQNGEGILPHGRQLPKEQKVAELPGKPKFVNTLLNLLTS